MPSSVRNSFIRVLEDVGGLSKDDAETYIEKMEASGRYQEETWS